MGYRGALVLLGTIPLLIAVGSYLAGEQVEVVALRSIDDEGRPHDTKLWVVEHEGRPWVRAVSPSLGWVERIRANPRVELIRDGVVTPHIATLVDSPDAKRAIDEAIAAKYGWIDRLYERVMQHDTIPVRLDPDLAESGG